MRSETYMVVDPRRDHSFRVPRPDLSAALRSPNACNDCHAAETADWAAARIAAWFPDGRWTEPHYGQALAAARAWSADARAQLVRLIDDASQPAIARATAVRLLGERLAPADTDLLGRSLDGAWPLVQLAAIEAAAGLAPDARIDLLQRFLDDERLALRTAAGRTLLAVRERLSIRRQADLDAAVAEYRAIQEFNGDRPEGLLSLGNLALEQGRYADAEALLVEAVARYPWHPALYVNLAELYRLMGRAAESEATLNAGLAAIPESPEIEVALGFALVLRGAQQEALPLLRAAALKAPDQPYFQYVYAIAESDVGDRELALQALRAAHERFPGHPETLYGLATMLRDAGEIEAAREFAARLVAVLPGDTAALSLQRQLEQPL
jgi:predicted Zn-dependent protease